MDGRVVHVTKQIERIVVIFTHEDIVIFSWTNCSKAHQILGQGLDLTIIYLLAAASRDHKRPPLSQFRLHTIVYGQD